MENTSAAPFAAPVAPTAGNIVSIAHRLYAARWGLIVGVSVVALVLNWLLSLVAGLLDAGLVGSDAFMKQVSMLAQVLVGAPLVVGPLYLTARLFRGEAAEFGDLFVGFRRWGPVVGTALFVQVALWLVMIPVGVGMATVGFGTGGSPVALLGVVLFGLVGFGVVIWVGIRLYFATLLCADPAGPRPGVMDSIRTGWTITRGHAWALFVVAVGLGLLAMVSLLLLVVPFLLYGAPMMACAAGVAYALVTHEAGLIPLAPYDDCPFCKYDLRGTASETCPECGATVPRTADAPAEALAEAGLVS